MGFAARRGRHHQHKPTAATDRLPAKYAEKPTDTATRVQLGSGTGRQCRPTDAEISCSASRMDRRSAADEKSKCGAGAAADDPVSHSRKETTNDDIDTIAVNSTRPTQCQVVADMS